MKRQNIPRSLIITFWDSKQEITNIREGESFCFIETIRTAIYYKIYRKKIIF